MTTKTTPDTGVVWQLKRQKKFKFNLSDITIMLWGQSRGTPPDNKGKNPFPPYSGFTPGTPVLPTCTSARRKYCHPRKMLEADKLEILVWEAY